MYGSVSLIGLGDKTMKFQGDTEAGTGCLQTHDLLSLPRCVRSRGVGGFIR